jgi:glutathione S-transferase
MYVLHYSPDTASLIVRLVLEELALPYQAVLIDRAGGALNSAAYRALHPLGKIPAFETPDGPMFETAAILLYLADRHGGLAPEPNAPERAAFLKWLFFTSTNIHTTLLQLFYPARVAGPDCIPAVLTHAHDRMTEYLDVLEAAATVNPDWLPDHKPSILGYYIGVLIRWLSGFDPAQGFHFYSRSYPALHRVLAYLETRPAALVAARDETLGPTIFTQPAY